MSEQAVVLGLTIKGITAASSAAAGVRLDQDRQRKKTQAKRQRKYETSYRRRHGIR